MAGRFNHGSIRAGMLGGAEPGLAMLAASDDPRRGALMAAGEDREQRAFRGQE